MVRGMSYVAALLSLKPMQGCSASGGSRAEVAPQRLSTNFPMTLDAWLRPLACSLRRLQVRVSDCGALADIVLRPAGLPACTRPEALTLEGSLEAPPSVAWPDCITSLAWCAFRATWLPAQVRLQR